MAIRPSSSARPSRATLGEWLTHCEALHPKGIEMSLDRVAEVRRRMAFQLPGVTVIVAGTNGKGSSCALLESITLAAGLRTGVYSKPHLIRFEERCRINGAQVQAEQLLPDFEAVEVARGDVVLTYFEFTTLAIAHHLSRHALDLVVLEVGLGGERDAVNVFDADCSLITGIDIDHVDFLGPDRESIGREKAGVMRAGRPIVVADPVPPLSIPDHADAVGAQLLLSGRDFLASKGDRGQWRWEGRDICFVDLPRPALTGSFQIRNAAGVLAVLEALGPRLPVAPAAICSGLQRVHLPGRFQEISRAPRVILDVAHNLQAVVALFANLSAAGVGGSVRAVFGCMKDKAVEEILRIGAPVVDAWYCCDLNSPRAMGARRLAGLLGSIGGKQGMRADVSIHASPQDAFRAAASAAGDIDTVLVFGSFLTVGGVLQAHGGIN